MKNWIFNDVPDARGLVILSPKLSSDCITINKIIFALRILFLTNVISITTHENIYLVLFDQVFKSSVVHMNNSISIPHDFFERLIVVFYIRFRLWSLSLGEINRNASMAQRNLLIQLTLFMTTVH